jgi:hypothetical protein
MDRRAEYQRLGMTPTPHDGTRLSPESAWDESSRPHRPASGPDVEYTRRDRLVGRHLVDVHDMLRRELDELRGVLAEVRDGARGAGEARSRNAVAGSGRGPSCPGAGISDQAVPPDRLS